MELFGLLVAIPVTFVASLVYTSLVIYVFHRWLVWRIVFVVISYCVAVLAVIEVSLLAFWGAKGIYTSLGQVFTAIHLLAFFLAPPAIAHIMVHATRRFSTWAQVSLATLCCWITCMVVVMGNIIIDEAIVGPDAGKPFYMTSSALLAPPSRHG